MYMIEDGNYIDKLPKLSHLGFVRKKERKKMN